MTISELGSIGEFVGAFGVIVTLIYLSIQIRGAKRIALSENVREVFDGYRKINIALLDPELNRIWLAGMENLDSLDQSEKSRFSIILSEYVLVFRESQIAHEQNVLSTQDYESYGGFVGALLNTPGGSAEWEILEGSFSENLSNEINRLRSSQPSLFSIRSDLAPQGK